jgi:hypothetical protein
LVLVVQNHVVKGTSSANTCSLLSEILQYWPNRLLRIAILHRTYLTLCYCICLKTYFWLFVLVNQKRLGRNRRFLRRYTLLAYIICDSGGICTLLLLCHGRLLLFTLRFIIIAVYCCVGRHTSSCCTLLIIVLGC